LALRDARDSLASTVATRRAQRSALWQDSTAFQDSFFAPDNRQDTLGNSEFAALTYANPRSGVRNANGHGAANGGRAAPTPRDDSEEPAGVVVDSPLPLESRTHH